MAVLVNGLPETPHVRGPSTLGGLAGRGGPARALAPSRLARTSGANVAVRQRLEYVRLPAQRGFRGALPRRWVVERTFAWFCHSRRFSRDYERLCATGEALIYVAMERLMLRRLAR